MSYFYTFIPSCFQQVQKIEAKLPYLIGYIYCLGASFCTSLRNMFVRRAYDVPHFQLFFLRVLSLCIIMHFILKWQRQPLVTSYKKINRLLVIIGLTGTVGGACSFYGFQVVPLNEATVIFQTQPVIASFLAVFLLKENFDFIQILSAIFCTIGILLVSKPSFLFGDLGNSPIEKNNEKTTGSLSLLLAALAIGFQSIFVKKVVSFVNSNLSVFYIGLIPSIFGSFLMVLEGVKPMTFDEWIVMTYIIVLGFFAQVLYNRSYRFGDAGKIVMMGYSQIIFGFVLDVLVLGSTLDSFSVIGALFVFGCVFLRLFKLWRDKAKE